MRLTPEYCELQKDLHARYDYGHGGDARECAQLALLYHPKSVLDYGCGQGKLSKLLPNVNEYDPCIEGKDKDPEPADVVVCADVLEHVEPDFLRNVLAHLRDLTLKRAILVIATGPSKKVMADGRQAHLTVKGAEWWCRLVEGYFNILTCEDRSETGRGVMMLCSKREN